MTFDRRRALPDSEHEFGNRLVRDYTAEETDVYFLEYCATVSSPPTLPCTATPTRGFAVPLNPTGLVNICRHSRATRSSTILRVTKNKIRLTVEDNGCGLPKRLNRIAPSSLARRAKLMKADIEGPLLIPVELASL